MKNLFIIALISLSTTCCATIICTDRQKVNITTYPDNAIVFDNGANIGRTPLIAKLKRKENHVIRIMLDGYEPCTIALHKKFNAVTFSNIVLVLGGIIGLSVDAGTGAMYRLSPAEIYKWLEKPLPSLSGFESKGGQTAIYVVMPELPQGEPAGQMTKTAN
jgi:uncharacterized Fe-S cluster-containing radical SAM superfamily protein